MKRISKQKGLYYKTIVPVLASPAKTIPVLSDREKLV